MLPYTEIQHSSDDSWHKPESHRRHKNFTIVNKVHWKTLSVHYLQTVYYQRMGVIKVPSFSTDSSMEQNVQATTFLHVQPSDRKWESNKIIKGKSSSIFFWGRNRTESRDLLKNPSIQKGYHEQDAWKAARIWDMQYKIPGNILKPDPE